MLVVGAGPAGCAAGAVMARAGAKVVVVDQATFPRPKTCGDALSNKAVRIVEDLCGEEVFRAAPHAVVKGSAAVFPDGTRIVRSYGDQPGRIVGRLELDDLLRRALERAGATVIEGVHVRKLTVEGGRVTGAESDTHRWRARGVIAADGHGSVAWTSLNEDHVKGAGLAISATAYFEGLGALGAEGFSEHYFEREIPCGYGWIFPSVQGVSNVGVYQRADAYQAEKVPLAKMLAEFIDRHRDRFKNAAQVGKTRTWSLPLAGVRRRARVDGLLVCGDAGRYIDPLTGEGIWQALFSGLTAGEVTAEALKRGGLDAAAAQAFRRTCWRRIDAPSAVREQIQNGMRVIVDRGLYRSRAVQAVLRAGFGSGSLEVSKSVA